MRAPWFVHRWRSVLSCDRFAVQNHSRSFYLHWGDHEVVQVPMRKLRIWKFMPEKTKPPHVFWINMMTSSIGDIFRALLTLCVGNSPVTGEFPSQRLVTRSFDVFFDLRLKIRLSKQWWGWWLETPSCSIWRHCNAKSWRVVIVIFHDGHKSMTIVLHLVGLGAKRIWCQIANFALGQRSNKLYELYPTAE